MKTFFLTFIITAIGVSALAQSSTTWVNTTDETITELYISLIDTEIWGRSLLEQPLKPGESATFPYPQCEDYNIKLVNENGAVCRIDQMYLCQDLVGFFADENVNCWEEKKAFLGFK